ncbi:leucine-rich repeat-containing protein 49-like isoform X1 [Portunus trituberculatus]|uniref:leucine-rich repeat-containing protein 49-like isoform X1 n=1 Tax=Portunus trituberculatus TaxID=210409 RepID=UPI001E1CD140|nr:leucine-rich repeat-containing protein 49-like isoform X1 [Portunus trituberculatus]
MLQQPKQRQSQSAAKTRKCENGKTLSLNVNGGRVFKTSDRPRTRPAAHLYGPHRTRTATTTTASAAHPTHGYRAGHQQAPPVPRQDLQMTPLTVPLLPHVPPRPILTQRMPTPLRSSRVYSGRRASPSRPSAPPPGQAQLTAQIQLLRPNNTPVSVEKVDLDRRGLTSWPALGAGEEPVRLLSLQHNLLTRVDPPSPSPSLVLLDLYHNHLNNLHGLHAFPNLRVLMLAKNRLSRLDGLEHLTKLEVLDLHGNQLHHLQGLAHLKELRLLNLAGNMLRHVTGLRGLDCLVELNLRRNLIRTVADLHYLPRLEKVFMGYNEIYRYEDLACLQNCLKLRELSLEENPISRQPHYFHHTVARFYRLKRLDDQELTMETRRQSEKVLQKAKEKERLQATRISDEEKRNSAITNAMKNWQVLKRQHRKLVRKPSESSTSTSDQPPSKDSDGTTSSGFCGDTVSDVGEEEEAEEEGKEEKEGKEGSTKKKEGEEEAKAGGEEKSPSEATEEQQQEDDRASLASSATSSGISDVSLVHRATKQRLTEVPAQPTASQADTDKETKPASESIKKVSKKTTAKCADKANLPRSKSYTDMRILKKKPSFEEDNAVKVKLAKTPEIQRGGCEAWGGSGRGGERITLEAAPRSVLPVQSLPVGRRGGRLGSPRTTEKTVPRIIANESGKRGNPKNFEVLKKSDGTRGAGHLPDKVVSAAITRVRSNLSLPVQSPEVPLSPRNAVSEPSEIDSSSDAESAATATTTNTAVTHTSLGEPAANPAVAPRGPHSLADLRVPLARPKEQERPAAEKIDKSVSAVGQSSTGILREQGPNFLAELEGERLSLYGQGALRCTDLAWEKSMAAAATTARFQYINYDDIVDIFPKLRVKFPRLENFIFVETHLAKCSQLNALAELHQVTSLEVGKEGNPLTQIPYWRLYAVFRLSHWGLRLIDGTEVNEEERTEAAVMFSHLSQLAFTCLPRDQLAAFLSSHHHHHPHHQNHPADDSTSPPPGSGGGAQDAGGGTTGREEDEGPRLNLPHLQDLIGKEALQYRPAARLTQRRRKEDNTTLLSAGRQARQLAVWTYDSLHRLHTHHSTWPSVLHDLVRDAVTDLAKPTYGKQCLEDVKRSLGWKK